MKDELKIVLDLIDNNSFKKAEKKLLELRKKKQTQYINYLLGYINHSNISPYPENKDKFKGSKENAKRYLGYAIESESPIEDAFWRLANLQDSKIHAVRILKKGLEYFPSSETIYRSLIQNSDESEIYNIYNDIETKKIVSNSLNFMLYEFFFKQKKYKKALNLIEKVSAKKKNGKQLLKLIIAFCLYETSDFLKAESIFQDLINTDLNQNLGYSQYFGLILCHLKNNQTSSIIKLINELPYKFDDPFVYLKSDLHFQFESYFEIVIKELIKLLKGKKEYKLAYAKIRGIKALKQCEFDNINKKTIMDLKFAKNNLENKEIFETELVSAYYSNEEIVEAFKIDLANSTKYTNYEPGICNLYEVSELDSKVITDMLIDKLNSTSTWQINKLKKVMEGVISLIHKNKRYEKIIEIISHYSDDVLFKTDVMFEIAYAYKKIGDNDNSKKFYEMIWESEQKSSAVANNLALIYEDEDDWYRAKELFELAIKLDKNDKIASDNLKRINDKINEEVKDIQKWEKELEESLDSIKKENTYIHQKIFSLMNAENNDHYIVASYRELSGILKASPEKVQELMTYFLQKKYLKKILNHNIDTNCNVYRINHLVKKFIFKREKRIEENKPYAIIGENINIDSIENLGFDKGLISTIDTKISDIKLKEILKRDLKENVLALLTESNKTALVLSGSIIESFVLNKILESGIVKHLPNQNAKKNKNVLNMNLSELLYVADKNNIIEIQLYHFSQALKQYRNFIHPAVEIRKSNLKIISDQDAKLAWEIAKKVIFEI